MSLEDWLKASWLRRHNTSREEIIELVGVLERSMRDADANISDDLRFAVIYEAALTLCTILLYASGFKPERSLHHYRTLQALPLILGEDYRQAAELLETARRKRNTLVYRRAGAVGTADVSVLLKSVEGLKGAVFDWMRREHSELL